jgi:hypothetical protein
MVLVVLLRQDGNPGIRDSTNLGTAHQGDEAPAGLTPRPARAANAASQALLTQARGWSVPSHRVRPGPGVPRYRRAATTARFLTDRGAPMTLSHVTFAAARPILPTAALRPRSIRPSALPDDPSPKSALSQRQYRQNPLRTATGRQDH